MAHDIQRSLIWIKTRNDLETWLINGAFGLLSVFRSDADLVAQLGTFIVPQGLFGLCEVVFDKIEESV